MTGGVDDKETAAYRLRLFDLVLEATRDGIWEWVVASDTVWSNERWNEIFGYARETPASFSNWKDRIHPDDRDRVLGSLGALQTHGESWENAYRIVHASGAARSVVDRGRVERDSEGKPLRFVGVTSDVTDMRAAEAARSEIDQQLRQMTEAIADVVWMADPVTREILYVSPSLERVFGRPPSDLLGDRQKFLSMVHPDDRARVIARSAAQLTGGYDETYRIIRKDGAIRWLQARAAPIHDPDGNIVRIAGIASDITAQRQLEEQLLQSRKMESVGRLAGGVAHDFNNLLTVMLAGCEFAIQSIGDNEGARSDIQQVQEAAERAAKLTNQLLAFARRQVLAPVRIDLNELARQMHKLLQRLIGEHIELATRLSPDLHPVLADLSQLEQVLVNLAANARDAMPEGGRLTLETSNLRVDDAYAEAHANVEPGDWVMLAVSDTGVGIPPEVQEHIFEPFFTTKPPGSGTGLGLATCYGIIRQIGGQILLYSEVGRGTTFKILFPRSSSGEVVVPTHVDTIPPGGNETVLFVEDDATVRAVGTRILAQRGYRVLEAWGGWEALRLAAEHGGPIHLLVTDVVMPQMSGVELARRLQERRPETRVLYASGYTEHAIINQGALDRALSFLQKPYAQESLLAKVRQLLDHPTAR